MHKHTCIMHLCVPSLELLSLREFAVSRRCHIPQLAFEALHFARQALRVCMCVYVCINANMRLLIGSYPLAHSFTVSLSDGQFVPLLVSRSYVRLHRLISICIHGGDTADNQRYTYASMSFRLSIHPSIHPSVCLSRYLA
jgi:hypothetical protein